MDIINPETVLINLKEKENERREFCVDEFTTQTENMIEVLREFNTILAKLVLDLGACLTLWQQYMIQLASLFPDQELTSEGGVINGGSDAT